MSFRESFRNSYRDACVRAFVVVNILIIFALAWNRELMWSGKIREIISSVRDAETSESVLPGLLRTAFLECNIRAHCGS